MCHIDAEYLLEITYMYFFVASPLEEVKKLILRSVSYIRGLREQRDFSPTGQEYPFLQVSEIFLSRPAISAWTLKAVSICQSLLNIVQPCSFQPLSLLLAM